MTAEPVIFPAYVDEAGARGLLRELKSERDQEISLMCALVFEPGGHAKAIEIFRPGFEAFCQAMPLDRPPNNPPPNKPGRIAVWSMGAALGCVLDCYWRSHEIAFAEFDAAMAQDVVRGGGVKIEIRQTEI
jgi:hypothetical protein